MNSFLCDRLWREQSLETKVLRRRESFLLEPLESRLLLSIDLVGVPTWTEQGPGPILNGNNVILTAQNRPQDGAVHSIAVDPNNANRVFIATTNGGVWGSTNATFSQFDNVDNDGDTIIDEADEVVSWTPLTDQFPSLSMGAVALSPLDANVVFAGNGKFSNGNADGQAQVGLLRSTDGGSIWTAIGGTTFNNQNIEQIVPTTLGGSLASQTVLVAAQNGVFRSTNGGLNWTSISGAFAPIDNIDNDGDGTTDEAGELNLPSGYAFDLVADPTNANRFYAAIQNQGVFRSDDGGATWRAVNTGITAFIGFPGGTATQPPPAPPNTPDSNSRIELAVSPVDGQVFVGLLNGTGNLANVSASTNQGGNWTPLNPVPNTNPGGQGNPNFAIVADPTTAGVVYVAGDTSTANNAGSLLRFNPGTGWTNIDNANANNTAPHPDVRDLVFDRNGNLLRGDDGGLYRLRIPNGPTGIGVASPVWDSVNGNLRATEFWSAAYDAFNDRIFGGTQDNGSPNQNTTNGLVWTDRLGGDGGIVAVETRDNNNDTVLDEFNRYMETQNIGAFQRIQFNAANPGGLVSNPALTVNGTGGNNTLNGAGTQPFGTPPAPVFDNTRQFVQPFVLNSVDPNRILFGSSFLYESFNQGATVNSLGGLTDLTNNNIDEDGDGSGVGGVDPNEWAPAGAVGPVTAMAYGGRLGGVTNADVTYVATNAGNLLLRTANTINSTADFAAVAGYSFGVVRDIVLDPDNWQSGYVVTANSQVFHFVNRGATAADWTNITGNLNPPPAAPNPALSTDLRTIEVFSPTTTPGDEIVLVGGSGGVFRTLNPFAGANALWTEFGAGLPNGLASDVRYNATDDVLLVGMRGRGAWTIADASDTLTVGSVLVVNGGITDDIIVLMRDPNNPSLLNVFENSATPTETHQLSTLLQINVNGLAGNDTLIIDSSNGLINVVDGIRYDGGTGVDDLQLVQTGGPTHVTDTYSVGPAIGSGKSTIVGNAGAGTQVVFFENLSPVLDLVPVALLTVNATAADNAITYTSGSPVTGLVTIDEHEPIEFRFKNTLTINAGAGQDIIGVNNPFTPTNLTAITINGGDPNSGDTLNVTGVGGAVAVNTATGTIIGATGAAGAVSIDYNVPDTDKFIESLNLLVGIGDLAITTTGADDTATVTPGLAAGGANSGTVQSSGAVPQIAFVNSGTFTANLAGGTDALVVNGSSLVDDIVVSGSAVTITGRRAVNYTGVEALTVNGNTASDTFTVTPAATVAMFIDGGDPFGQLPGDLLNIVAGGASVTFNAGPGADKGSFVVFGNQPVSFDHIESAGVNGGTSAVINGTSGPDAITVIARDRSTHLAIPILGAGVQDFTVSVNGGPEILFIDLPTVTINAGSGSDVVTLAAPAPNNADWNVSVTINGGTPATDTDQLIVQTPGPLAEDVVYTPNLGTLDLTSITSLVTINGIDGLSYDGQGDNDSLTIRGTSGDDAIIHNPGANDQAGSFQVNSLLALGYQNLGGGGSLTVDGTGGTDTLAYNGTAANDTFLIGGVIPGPGSADDVNLNSRLVVNTAGVETLTLEGLAGDDTFTLVPAISASVYTTINLNGGGQSSATGDRVFLVGTAPGPGTGNDIINISGQVVSMGTPGPTLRTINSSGIEDIRLDALGGNDLITYNGVAGISENITVSSSGTAGGGQISVPGVTLINFSSVEHIVVNGNALAPPTETDTLTFAGTNAVDTFNINLAAIGTGTDPVLKLQNGSPLPLLTLDNYTNFNTLRVNGLDSADTFNVTVAGNSPSSRNLFVDGGQPSGKKKVTDNLNVIYVPPRPSIIHSAATQDPDAGIVDLDYGTARFVVQYDDIEQVTIRRQ